jgi:Uncharacterized protein conserved in bacteria
VRVLLATAPFLWAARNPEKVSRTALSTLRRTNSERRVSAVSIAEIATKHARGKLAFRRDEVLSALEDFLVSVYRIAPSMPSPVRASSRPRRSLRPPDHRPSRAEDIPVIPSDGAFRRYKELKLIW